MNPYRTLCPPPRNQALSSTTFHPPPLDGTLTIPEMYEWHLHNSVNHPLFIFSADNGSIRVLYWPEVVHAIRRCATLVRKTMNRSHQMNLAPVVAILASLDSVTYFTMIVAIMRAGYTPFPISPRNSPVAIAHLLSEVGVKHVFIGRGQAVKNLGNDASVELKKMHAIDVDIMFFPVPLFEDIYNGSESSQQDDIPYKKGEPDDIAFYVHSSGSTAFPKPIPWKHHQFIQFSLAPYFGERDLTGQVISMHAVPMFHLMGISQIAWTASCGTVLSVFEPRCPAIFPTTQSHFDAAVATDSKIVACVPSVVEEWSSNPEYVQWLKNRVLLFGGGPLNQTVGDYLVSQGVSLFSLYGCSECGIMTKILPAKIDEDWGYFCFPENILPHMIPVGQGIYELVILENSFCGLSVINANINGVKAYTTSDLLTEHPTKPGHWKIYGRKDDQIMHSTGEKTNPCPLENILNQDPRIQSSVMFGRGEFQVGVLLEPKVQLDTSELAAFRDYIWPTIRKMNEYAPQHSRVFKEMILVAKSDKPFQYSPKNTPRRQAILEDYAEEIMSLYATISESTQPNIVPPESWDLSGSIDFVRSTVNSVLINPAEDDVDIFQLGCDSLQAAWIRNALLRGLRDTSTIDARNIPDNFVYNEPTILRMGSYLNTIATGIYKSPMASSAEIQISSMRAMVYKYTTLKPTAHCITSQVAAQKCEETGDVVLVTGTTGALGSYLLAELVKHEGVSRVYAINRSRSQGSGSLRERQARALTERGLEAFSILASEKVVLIEADLSLSQCGFPDELYKKVSSTITHIIHNAWPMNFSLALTSFEESMQGLRNLVDMALNSVKSPLFIYTSTIGVFQDVRNLTSLEEIPIAPDVSIGLGYTESKWVAEEIILHNSMHNSLKSVIIRVGQLCGGINGCWNTNEWFPSMVQSTLALGCLPSDGKQVDWIPLHVASRALLDCLEAEVPTGTILHLVNPRSASWSAIAGILAKDLKLELVPFSEWMRRLQNMSLSSPSYELLRRIPALRLLPFFRSMENSILDRTGISCSPRISLRRTMELLPTLSALEIQLGEPDVHSWLRFWREAGFLNQT